MSSFTPRNGTIITALIFGVGMLASLILIFVCGQPRAGIVAPAIGRIMAFTYLAAAVMSYVRVPHLSWLRFLGWCVPGVIIIGVSRYIGGDHHLVEMAIHSWSWIIASMLLWYAVGAMMPNWTSFIKKH